MDRLKKHRLRQFSINLLSVAGATSLTWSLLRLCPMVPISHLGLLAACSAFTLVLRGGLRKLPQLKTRPEREDRNTLLKVFSNDRFRRVAHPQAARFATQVLNLLGLQEVHRVLCLATDLANELQSELMRERKFTREKFENLRQRALEAYQDMAVASRSEAITILGEETLARKYARDVANDFKGLVVDRMSRATRSWNHQQDEPSERQVSEALAASHRRATDFLNEVIERATRIQAELDHTRMLACENFHRL